jgi:Tat protein secretion system quality control protein TatD with DNase activity
MLDSHCHIKRSDPSASRGSPSNVASQWAGAVFFGTHPSVDWDIIDQLAASGSQLVRGYGFGVHPWYVPQGLGSCTTEASSDVPPSCSCAALRDSADVDTASWAPSVLLAMLEEKLIAHPAAWVGEIGLDKLRPADRSLQEGMFLQQLALAAKYRRGVSVHCVRSFGPLLTMLTKLPKAQFPPAVVLHGFTGSPDFVTSLLKLPNAKSDRIFFGIGENTTFRLKNFEQLIRCIPPQRVLLESDQHWVLDSVDDTVRLEPPEVMSSAFTDVLPASSLRDNTESLLQRLRCVAL